MPYAEDSLVTLRAADRLSNRHQPKKRRRRYAPGSLPSVPSHVHGEAKDGSREDLRSWVEVRHHPALEFVRKRVADLLHSGELNAATATRALELLRDPLTHADYSPIVTAEEDELTLLWLVGSRSLEVSVPDYGDAYLRVTDGEGRELMAGLMPRLPTARLRRWLDELSADAGAAKNGTEGS